MDSCWNNAPRWSNIHQQGFDPDNASGSIPNLVLDPIQDPTGAGISWDEGVHIPSSSSLMLMNHTVINPGQLSGLMSDHVVHQCQPFDGSKGTTSGTMDRLLSGNNSNTDTTTNSVEDDGISMMVFSEGRNLWDLDTTITTNNNSNSNNPRKRSCDNNNNDDNNIIHLFDEDDMCQQTSGAGFTLIRNNNNNNNNNSNPAKGSNKRKKLINSQQLCYSSTNNISFQQGGCGGGGASSSGSSIEEPDAEAIQQMKEMIYRAAAFRPVNFGVEAMERPKRKNVRISSDPQTVAARQRRERISERLRVLQKLVPGGSKMDTASMLDEAANYLKFLRNQVKVLEAFGNNNQKLDNYHHHSFLGNHNLQFSIPTIDPHAIANYNTSLFIAKP